MTDWIDDFGKQLEDQEAQRAHYREVFPAQANRVWRTLVAQIRHDASRLNAKYLPIMKGEIKINDRELIPNDNELYVDKLAFPAIRLTLRLNTSAGGITIDQTRKETVEGSYGETSERLELQLTSSDQITIKDSNGQEFTIEDASKYILERFLK